MKNTLKAFALILLAFALPQFAHAQQYTLGMTTLSAAATASATYVQVTSATSIYGTNANHQPIPSSSATPQTLLYIDREQMIVLSVSGTTLQVRRGANGTTGAAHASGQMVLSGPAVAFYTYDPGGTPGSGGGGVSGVACTATAVLVTPWLNVRTGAQWLCSTISNTWIPGFNNPANSTAPVPNTVVASVGGATLPSGPLFHVSGTNAITSWTQPVGCNATAVGGCSFVTIPDAAFTWAGGGNMAATGTAVANLPIIWIWDTTNSKWVALQSK